ncbi:hypothetical protein RINTHH_11810 [Richelia intracellularis HH01]|uniref:Uncharacterized protein n=1 Tax=Richelia intracellularis HH01 TaxID=1165094 RepID=M1X5H3_9NOST|nr:hypothetical protein RINTHH_11810 [Richelia intracellularis HH01]
MVINSQEFSQMKLKILLTMLVRFGGKGENNNLFTPINTN